VSSKIVESWLLTTIIDTSIATTISQTTTRLKGKIMVYRNPPELPDITMVFAKGPNNETKVTASLEGEPDKIEFLLDKGGKTAFAILLFQVLEARFHLIRKEVTEETMKPYLEKDAF
jgi:hypothetical protein